jgi:hypothetical protein
VGSAAAFMARACCQPVQLNLFAEPPPVGLRSEPVLSRTLQAP